MTIHPGNWPTLKEAGTTTATLTIWDMGGTEKVLEFPNSVLLPGFVDLHTHPAPSNWKYGIDPDKFILTRGTTTILSQGDAGANNWSAYKDNIISKSNIRIRMALSPSINGEEYTHPVYANLINLYCMEFDGTRLIGQ